MLDIGSGDRKREDEPDEQWLAIQTMSNQIRGVECFRSECDLASLNDNNIGGVAIPEESQYCAQHQRKRDRISNLVNTWPR